ncbi:hypothetical protein AB0M46_40910 [Dactylosporangium sp. NPDC051485]|uniref:hypothetical protein n=1 Tax=Dactylosporangium sp. NPDC051485 TaxID=3154846 RepID=UPI003424F3BD
MQRFSVHAEYVGRYGDLLDRAKEATRDAKEYAEANGEISGGEQGWLALLGNAHETIMNALRAELDGLRDACAGGASALHRAAGYYGHTDQTAAADFDGKLDQYNDREDYTLSHYDNGRWKP